MKNLILVGGLMLLSAISAFTQKTCTRHTETAGKFSYCPPVGWVVSGSSGSGYKKFAIPTTESAVRININLEEEATSVSNDGFTAAGIKLILSGKLGADLKAVKVVGWKDFASASNLKGSRVVFESVYKGTAIRTLQYVFDFPGKKLVLTGTASPASPEATDRIFDVVASSLKLEP